MCALWKLPGVFSNDDALKLGRADSNRQEMSFIHVHVLWELSSQSLASRRGMRGSRGEAETDLASTLFTLAILIGRPSDCTVEVMVSRLIPHKTK